MDRGYQRCRGIQLTIPSMMQQRDGTHNFTSPMSPMSSGVGSSGSYCQPQSTMSTPRMTPYKVPFQRRQLAEPVYADSAPVMIPQPIQLSSPYGLGTIYGGASGLYIPTYQQNIIEPHTFENSHNLPCFNDEMAAKNEHDAYVTGLTSSPPNHPLPQEAVAKTRIAPMPFPKEKENIQGPVPGKLEPKYATLKENQKETKVISAAPKQPFDLTKISMRVLTGSIEKVMKWEKLWENKMDKPIFLFEIIAPLLQLKTGSKAIEKQILLREPGGPVLTVVYYEIDRGIPQLTIGEYARCVCRPLGKRRYQAFSVRPATQKEFSCLERLSFLSHRAVQEALLSTPEP